MDSQGCYECGGRPDSELDALKKCRNCGRVICLEHSLTCGSIDVPVSEIVKLCIPCYRKM